jgi:NAD+ diphosphatase
LFVMAAYPHQHRNTSANHHHDGPTADLNLDAMLPRKIEEANYFAGSPLNRVAFLRSDHGFLSCALRHPSAAFVLLSELAPFTASAGTLAYASHADVQALIGEDPFSRSEEEMVAGYNSDSEAVVALVVFLGLYERQAGGVEWKGYRGIPHFAVDVTPKGLLKERAERLIGEVQGGREWKPLKGRTNLRLDALQGGLLSNSGLS